MTSITGILPSSYSYPYSQSGNVAVAKTADSGLSSSAVELSMNAGLVAGLTGSSLGSTYNATGILNSIAQAGQASSTTATDNSGLTASQSQDLGVVGNLSASPSASGVYSGSGVLQGLPSGWADVLKSNPELATEAANSAAQQGIIGSLLSTIA